MLIGDRSKDLSPPSIDGLDSGRIRNAKEFHSEPTFRSRRTYNPGPTNDTFTSTANDVVPSLLPCMPGNIATRNGLIENQYP